MILAGDVGGTKTRIAVYEEKNGRLVRREIEKYDSAKFQGLAEIVKDFLGRYKVSARAACFGVPGPVMDGKAKTTNLPWRLTEKELETHIGVPRVRLINDLAAVAAAIPYFSPEDLITLHPGEAGRDKTLSAVLAPGTGLGQAFLFSSDGKHYTLASEGGHADFPPNSEIEIELLRYLGRKYEHVSLERVLCGPGLVNIYNFLRDTGYAEEPLELRQRFEKEVPAVVISAAGLSGEFQLCVKVLDIFASVLGAQAGNLVLTLMATGGVYLGGGIPPKIASKLEEGATVSSYLKKGRLSGVVKTTPLYIIKDDHAALLGSANIAARL